MSTLAPLTEPLVRLFLRIDAAQPTDALLHAALKFWQAKRKGRIAPSQDEMRDIPHELSPFVFHAQLMSNGTRHWVASGAGHVAGSLLRLTDGDQPDVGDKRIAVRLRRLFDIVADKSEPYSAMFEISEPDRRRRLVEVLAAPLGDTERNTHLIFAALNSRIEAG